MASNCDPRHDGEKQPQQADSPSDGNKQPEHTGSPSDGKKQPEHTGPPSDSNKQPEHTGPLSNGSKQPLTPASTIGSINQSQKTSPVNDGAKELQATIPTSDSDDQAQIAAPTSVTDEYTLLVMLGRIVHHAAWKHRERLIASKQDHPFLIHEDPITYNNTFLRKDDEKLPKLNALQILRFLENEGYIPGDMGLTVLNDPSGNTAVNAQTTQPAAPTTTLPASDSAVPPTASPVNLPAGSTAPSLGAPPSHITAPPSQIAAPSSEITAEYPHVSAPSSDITAQSSQITAPPQVITAPSSQITAPSAAPSAPPNISSRSAGNANANPTRRTSPGEKWTDQEMSVTTFAVKEGHSLYPGDNEKHKMWAHVKQVRKRHGFERSDFAVRMWWNRTGRPTSGFDERSQNRVRKKGNLTTCAQTSRKRKAASNANKPPPKRTKSALPVGDAQQPEFTQDDDTVHASSLLPQTTTANFSSLAPSAPSQQSVPPMNDFAAQHQTYAPGNYFPPMDLLSMYPLLQGESYGYTAQPANPYAAAQTYMTTAQPISTSSGIPSNGPSTEADQYAAPTTSATTGEASFDEFINFDLVE